MVRVGLRELENRLGTDVQRVKAGERIVVTERNRPVAAVVPVDGQESAGELLALVRDGVVSWNGGKPRGLASPPVMRERTVAVAVLEDRR